MCGGHTDLSQSPSTRSFINFEGEGLSEKFTPDDGGQIVILYKGSRYLTSYLTFN